MFGVGVGVWRPLISLDELTSWLAFRKTCHDAARIALETINKKQVMFFAQLFFLAFAFCSA